MHLTSLGHRVEEGIKVRVVLEESRQVLSAGWMLRQRCSWRREEGAHDRAATSAKSRARVSLIASEEEVGGAGKVELLGRVGET